MASETLPDHEFAQRLREAILHSAGAAGVPAQQAEDVASRSVDTLRHMLGGQRAYLAAPRPTKRRQRQRAAELQARGLTVREVAARLSISVAHAYRLCSQAKRLGNSQGAEAASETTPAQPFRFSNPA